MTLTESSSAPSLDHLSWRPRGAAAIALGSGVEASATFGRWARWGRGWLVIIRAADHLARRSRSLRASSQRAGRVLDVCELACLADPGLADMLPMLSGGSPAHGLAPATDRVVRSSRSQILWAPASLPRSHCRHRTPTYTTLGTQ